MSRAVFDRALVDAAVAAGARLVPEKAVDVTRQPGRDDRANRSRRVRHRLPARRRRRQQHRPQEARSSRSGARSSRWRRASSSTARQLRASPSRPRATSLGICGRFPGPIIWRSASAPRLPTTPRQAMLRAQSATWIEQHDLHRNTRLTPYAWPIPSIGYQARGDVTLGGEGWMLLGDAAGLVDPLTREGIYFALLSGQWAADALAATAGPRAASRYADRVLREIQPELARAARLSRLFFTPAFSSLFVRALDQSEAHSRRVRRPGRRPATVPRPPAAAARDTRMDARRACNSDAPDPWIYWYNDGRRVTPRNVTRSQTWVGLVCLSSSSSCSSSC